MLKKNIGIKIIKLLLHKNKNITKKQFYFLKICEILYDLLLVKKNRH